MEAEQYTGADQTIRFEPHFHTLTKAGSSHFLRPADAIAEFIDNSIQACRGVKPERSIDISLILTNRSGMSISCPNMSGFLLVADNGCGMNVNGIREFATFSLDQEVRNESILSQLDRSIISKFGVGVKQAGFFLGSRIRVITKTQTAESFLEFSLDSVNFEQRYLNREHVYEGKVRTISLENFELEALSSDELSNEQLVSAIKSHVSNYRNQFAIFIIKLRPEIVSKLLLQAKYTLIKNEIAEIYHFHLHPSHRFDHIEESFKTYSNKVTGNKRTRRDEIFTEEDSPLEIKYYAYINDILKENHSLSKVEDYVSICKERAGDIYKFQMDIPDPEPEQGKRLPTQLSQIVGSEQRHSVVGFFMYFPFADGEETRPQMDYRDNIDTAGNYLVRVYWQDRLVPETTVNQIPFLPNSSQMVAKLEKEGVSRKWKDRIVGFIFLDWKFRHISNNKLKIRVEPDLSTWLNSKELKESLTFCPKSIHKDFIEWLKQCSRNFDREYYFDERYFDLISEGVLDSGNQLNSLFRKLTFLQGGKSISAGDKIKWAKKGADSHVTVYGEIVDFFINQELPILEKFYFGCGYFRYKRMPQEVFGNSIYTESIISINFQDYLFKEKEITSLLSSKPTSIVLKLFSVAGDAAEVISNGMEFEVGREYYKIGVQILDSNKRIIFSPPDMTGPKQRYQVALACGSKKFGKTCDIYEFDLNSNDDTSVQKFSKKSEHRYYYGFYKMKFDMPSAVELTATVIAPDNTAILSTVVSVKLCSNNASKLKLVDAEEVPSAFLGGFLPRLEFQLCDERDFDVNYVGMIRLELFSDRLSILSRDEKEFVTILKDSDNGRIICDANSWQIKPLEGTNISKNKLGHKVMRISARAFVLNSKVDSKNNKSSERAVGKAIQFELDVHPGVPSSLILVEPKSLEISNNSEVPILRLASVDEWGNKTAPMDGESWQISAGEGPLNFSEMHPLSVQQSSGEVSVLSVPCQYSGKIPIEGAKIQQIFTLQRYSKEGKQIHDTFNPFSLTIFLHPSHLPVALEIWKSENGDAHNIDGCSYECGFTLKDLSFKALSPDGQLIDLAKYLGKQKSSWLECSWVVQGGKQKRCKISEDCSLPNLQIPVTTGPAEFTIDLVLDGKQLGTSFTLFAKAGSPLKWSLKTSASFNEGLVLGDVNDLRKKLLGAFLCDRFGNLVDADERCPPPLISVEPVDDDEELRSTTAATDLQDSEETKPSYLLMRPCDTFAHEIGESSSGIIKGFILDDSCILIGFRPGKPLRLKLFDKDGTFDEDTLDAMTTSGVPYKLLISSPLLRIEKPNDNQFTEVTSFTKIIDLKLEIVDKENNLASLSGTVELRLEIIGPNGATVFTKKNPKSAAITASINYSFAQNSANLEESCMEDGEDDHSIEMDNMEDPLDTDSGVKIFRCKLLWRSSTGLIVNESALLHCKVVKGNNVIDLILRAAKFPSNQNSQIQTQSISSVNSFSGLSRSGKNYELRHIAADAFPEIRIVAVTDDGSQFLPEISNLALSIRRCGVEKSKAIKVSEFFVCEQSDFEFATLLNACFDTTQAATYNCTIRYTETRQHLSHLPKSLGTILVDLIIIILPGEPCRLRLDDHSWQKLKNAEVTNSIHAQFRTFAENVRVYQVDQFNNKCEFRPNQVVVCRIAPLVGHTLTHFPVLHGSNSTGDVFGEIRKEECCFPSLLVESSATSTTMALDDGSYNLCFALMDKSRTSLFATLDIKFIFTSEGKFQEYLALKRQRCHLIKEEIARFQKLVLQQEKIDKKIVELQRRPSVTAGLSAAMSSNSQLETLLHKREQDLLDMRTRATQRRPTKKRINVPDAAAIVGCDYIGLVVDLAFVNDLNEARILSWAASPYLDSLLVNTTDQAKHLFKKGVKCSALKQIISFSIPSGASGQIRERNSKELKSCALPLPPILGPNKKTPAGNPRYIVNIISLTPENEYLRDSLFFEIYGRSIIFDDEDSAFDYREYLVQGKQTPPAIYTLTGKRFLRQSIFDPSSNNQLPERLEYVFGEPSTSQTEGLQQIEDELEILSSAMDLLREKAEVENQINSIDVESLSKELKGLDESL